MQPRRAGARDPSAAVETAVRPELREVFQQDCRCLTPSRDHRSAFLCMQWLNGKKGGSNGAREKEEELPVSCRPGGPLRRTPLRRWSRQSPRSWAARRWRCHSPPRTPPAAAADPPAAPCSAHGSPPANSNLNSNLKVMQRSISVLLKLCERQIQNQEQSARAISWATRGVVNRDSPVEVQQCERLKRSTGISPMSVPLCREALHSLYSLHGCNGHLNRDSRLQQNFWKGRFGSKHIFSI